METLLRLEGITKAFPGVQALAGVDLELARGEVHALLGENGAGKSTLVKIVAGVYPCDQGSLYFEGRRRSFASPAAARRSGIAVMHQETSLVAPLTVLENVYLGIEQRWACGILDERATRRRYDEACARFGFRLPADRQVRDLTIAEQKMTEILKAMVRQASFLIMDEPTDALAGAEIEHLFGIIRELKAGGVTVLYITHYLDEVFRITDRLTVLRDGRRVATVSTASVGRGEVVRLMIGQESGGAAAPGSPRARGPEALRAEGLTRRGAVAGASFTAYRGEILGITGALGSGKTELARLLFGADRADAGRLFVAGRPVVLRSPRDAVRQGIGLLPEDRKRQGLILQHEVYKNLSLTALRRYKAGPVVLRARELGAGRRIVERLAIKITGFQQRTGNLSGGNQQKVVVGKWLAAEPRILVMDEPTRGIDVGSKAEIHRIMRELADQGTCLLFISAEVPEILRVSDRILVMSAGRIAAEFGRGASQEQVLQKILQGEGS